MNWRPELRQLKMSLLKSRLDKVTRYVYERNKLLPKAIILRPGQSLADEKQRVGISENEKFFLVTLKI